MIEKNDNFMNPKTNSALQFVKLTLLTTEAS